MNIWDVYTADREIDQEALRSFLAEELTDYMVPTAYMQLDEMPLTPNGKVNTKALPNPDIQADEIVAPVTPSEKALFKLAAEMLKHEQFGITSNLIAMGLTSLSAMRFQQVRCTAFSQGSPAASNDSSVGCHDRQQKDAGWHTRGTGSQ